MEWIFREMLNLMMKTMSKIETYNSTIIGDLLQEITPRELERTEKRMLLAVRINNAIDAKGWKKKDFAIALGKQPSEITKWLSGTHNFTADTLSDIEHVLGINILNLESKPKEIITKLALNITIDTSKEHTPQWAMFYPIIANSKFTRV